MFENSAFGPHHLAGAGVPPDVIKQAAGLGLNWGALFSILLTQGLPFLLQLIQSLLGNQPAPAGK